MSQPALVDLAAGIQAPSRPKRARQAMRVHPLWHLESKGPRGVKASWCRACGAPILLGADADFCAFDVRADATPLDATGELLAALSRPFRPTYTLERLGRVARLTRRRAAAMRARPAGPRQALLTWDVVPEHRCGQQLPQIPTNLTEDLMTKESDVCPF